MKVLISTDLYTTNTNSVVTSVRILTEELETLAAQLGIANHVIFTGMVDPSNVHKTAFS